MISPNAILNTLKFSTNGEWSEIESKIYKKNKLFNLHGILKLIGKWVKTPKDIFNLNVRYRLKSDDFFYDSIQGSDGLCFGATLYGWRPGIEIKNPYDILGVSTPKILGKEPSEIIDLKTGERAETNNLKTPYELIKWTKYWIDIFYSQDDGNDESWKDEPDPNDPRELVPVPVLSRKWRWILNNG